MTIKAIPPSAPIGDAGGFTGGLDWEENAVLIMILNKVVDLLHLNRSSDGSPLP
jgi:hypothetical protein